MTQLKPWIETRLADHPDVNSILVYSSSFSYSPLTGGYDFVVLVVTKEQSDSAEFINHYIKDHTYIQERWVKPSSLVKWVLSGQERNIIHWLVEGEICLDNNSVLVEIKNKIVKFEKQFRDQKMLLEFSLFLRNYLASKQNLNNGNLMDAYGSILEAIFHWARIAIIESGIHPEVMVWEQVRRINPGIYKLYEELTLTTETLQQRIELAHLACEFSVMSKMEGCCSLLIKILKSRVEPWSPSDLMNHNLLCDLQPDIALVLKKLTTKNIVKEIVAKEEDGLQRLLYTC